MIRAYNENMVEKAQVTLGSAFDFAAHEIGYTLTDFMSLFIESGYARQFEAGNPAIVMGRSGIELALLVAQRTLNLQRPIRIRYALGYSEEFWCGWALAYYQWRRSESFAHIAHAVPMEQVQALYATFHETDIRRFCAHMDELLATAYPDTNLKRLRKRASMTQEELANLSGVPIRTIQQYEQRRKDVNKAQVETALKLARALGCNPEDLTEHTAA